MAAHDATLDDVPDIPARPVAVLARAAREANLEADHVCYARGAHELAALLIELQVHVVSGDSDTQRAALAALVETCMAAQGLARTLGHAELALTLARRGYDAARRLGRDDLVGLMAMNRGHALMRIGARHRATAVLTGGLDETGALPGPTPKDTTVGEARGMLHLSAALLSARDGRPGDAGTHLDEADSLAAHTGERNHMRYHFGPSNVAAWKLTVAVENGTGPTPLNALRRHRSTCRCSTAETENPICISISPARGRRPTAHATTKRCVRWTPRTASPRYGYVTTRLPVIWC